MVKTWILIILLSISSTTFSQSDFTIDPETSKAIPNYVGKVTLLKGSATKVKKNGDLADLALGMKFYEGESVKTAKASLIKIEMVDDTELALGPKSNFKFSQFKFKDKKDRKSVYEFISGQLRAHVPIKAKPGDIKFNTRTSSLGIRGTIFLANFKQAKDGKAISETAVLEGEVVIRGAKGKSQEMLKSGEHFISIEKDNEQFEESIQTLDSDYYKSLLAADADFAKNFLPFLDYYQVKNEETGRGPSSIGVPEVENKESINPRKSKNWREILKNLNHLLNGYSEK